MYKLNHACIGDIDALIQIRDIDNNKLLTLPLVDWMINQKFAGVGMFGFWILDIAAFIKHHEVILPKKIIKLIDYGIIEEVIHSFDITHQDPIKEDWTFFFINMNI